MIHQVFSIFDNAAKVYNKPFFLKNRYEAVRMFGDLVRDEQSMLSKHPQDFSLFHVGSFDDESAELINLKVPDRVMLASDVKLAQEK